MELGWIDDAQDHISEAAVANSAVKRIPKGSLLFVVRGMILAHSFPTAITTREVTINQDMKALVLARPDLGEFLLRSCQAARTRILQKVVRSTHGTCRLESKDLEQFPLAIPSLAEQKRIVAKVNQLMALCAELESKLRDAEKGAERLAEGMTAAMVM
ncbi:restriction endonuclease subunit S [Archangium lipolyticum]|uniref:restriction endonuclease subunit S n=1 Tax=Archangium lipolyticum TaxID=2970465 RepID=UPI002149A0AC|nr:restriction endonuclease subunit S [Archangium lipolyticum]